MKAYGYGYSSVFFKNRNQIVSQFKERVLSDSGTFEANNCLNSNVNYLKALRQLATTFNLRVLADSGTFEQINCLQTTITDLQNININ